MVPGRDFRKLDPATQAELRRVAVSMVEAGKTRIEAAEAVGVNRRFVGEWVEAARQGGQETLSGGRRGRHRANRRPCHLGRRAGSGGCWRASARTSWGYPLRYGPVRQWAR